MVLRKKVIENFKTEKLQGSVTYTSIIIFPTFCVSVYTLYLIIICQVFDFFFFFFRFKIWVITSKEGKRGGKENSKRQLTLNREKKKKKKEALHFFFFSFMGSWWNKRSVIFICFGLLKSVTLLLKKHYILFYFPFWRKKHYTLKVRWLG